MKKATLLISIFFLFISINLYAQGWEKKYGGVNSEQAYDVKQTPDGGFIVTGVINTNPATSESGINMLKLDANGEKQWEKVITDSIYKFLWSESIGLTNDGGYIIGGGAGTLVSGTYIYPMLIKTDNYGNIIWRNIVDTVPVAEYGFHSVQQTTDGGYIATGGGTGLAFSIILYKANADGTTAWVKNCYYDGTSFSVQQTSDGGYIIAGITQINYPDDVLLIKTDANGDTTWTRYYGGSQGDEANEVRQTSDGGYIIAGGTMSFGNGNHEAYVIKTDANGDTLWTKTYGTTLNDHFESVAVNNDGSYTFAGHVDMMADTSRVWLMKTDNTGQILWEKRFHYTQGFDWAYSVQKTAEGGYIIAGFSNDNTGITGEDMYLIKTDGQGNTHTNYISGNIFYDKDGNASCTKDSSDIALNQWIVKVEPGTRYASTNANGDYSISVDSGNYTVSEIIPNYLWKQVCPAADYNLNFSQFYDTLTDNNFANQVVTFCPLMWVDVSTNLIRPCQQNTYTVNYCNNGTTDAVNSYITFTLSDKMYFVSSTATVGSVNGSTYRFDLGTVAVGQCGSFYVTVFIDCNAVMNSTLCVEAKVYPDTTCSPVDTIWDKSSLVVSGECVNDSLACFTIKNVGSNMNGTTQYRVYANDTLIQTVTFQLNAGDSIVYCIAAGGKTIRLEADQRPGHKGNSKPRATVEGCGNPDDFGFVTTVPQDDADDFVEIDCQIVRASYDPNEKLVQPGGITASRYISEKDELEYQVNFQNTGNDTAFLVVIRDTIDVNTLDIPTIQSGASSFPYSFRVYGQGILEWTFNNINLPDSNINEPASHGFVKYRIHQKASNPKGTVIENKAAIYFDFNAPVITEKAWVTVYDTVFNNPTSLKQIVNEEKTEVKVYPNPFSSSAVVRITNGYEFANASSLRGTKQSLTFTIYDLLGKEVKQLIINNQFTIINSQGLTSGMYFYKIMIGKESIANGKLVIQE